MLRSHNRHAPDQQRKKAQRRKMAEHAGMTAACRAYHAEKETARPEAERRFPFIPELIRRPLTNLFHFSDIETPSGKAADIRQSQRVPGFPRSILHNTAPRLPGRNPKRNCWPIRFRTFPTGTNCPYKRITSTIPPTIPAMIKYHFMKLFAVFTSL